MVRAMRVYVISISDASLHNIPLHSTLPRSSDSGGAGLNSNEISEIRIEFCCN